MRGGKATVSRRAASNLALPTQAFSTKGDPVRVKKTRQNKRSGVPFRFNRNGAPGEGEASRTHAFAEIFDRGFGSALAVGDIERIEGDFDDAERAQDHRGVDVAHMGDPERLSVEVADPGAQHHAAFFLAV